MPVRCSSLQARGMPAIGHSYEPRGDTPASQHTTTTAADAGAGAADRTPSKAYESGGSRASGGNGPDILIVHPASGRKKVSNGTSADGAALYAGVAVPEASSSSSAGTATTVAAAGAADDNEPGSARPATTTAAADAPPATAPPPGTAAAGPVATPGALHIEMSQFSGTGDAPHTTTVLLSASKTNGQSGAAPPAHSTPLNGQHRATTGQSAALSGFGSSSDVPVPQLTAATTSNGSAGAPSATTPTAAIAPPCEYCTDDAIAWDCVDCRQLLCDVCDSVLHKGKTKRPHTRYALQLPAGAMTARAAAALAAVHARNASRGGATGPGQHARGNSGSSGNSNNNGKGSANRNDTEAAPVEEQLHGGRAAGLNASNPTATPPQRPRTAGAARLSDPTGGGPGAAAAAAGAAALGGAHGRLRPQSAHTHAERTAAVAAAAAASGGASGMTSAGGSLGSSGSSTPMTRPGTAQGVRSLSAAAAANAAGQASWVPPPNTTGKYRFAWPPQGSVTVCEFSVRLEYMSARDSDMRYPSGLGEYVQFTMAWAPTGPPQLATGPAAAAATATGMGSSNGLYPSQYMEVVCRDYKVVNATTGITKPLVAPLQSGAGAGPGTRPGSASLMPRTPFGATSPTGSGGRTRSFIIDADGQFVCLSSTFDPALPQATNFNTARGAPRSPWNNTERSPRPPSLSGPAPPTPSAAANGAPAPPVVAVESNTVSVPHLTLPPHATNGIATSSATASQPAATQLPLWTPAEEKALQNETSECRSFWHAMVTAFLGISTSETKDNEFFIGKRPNAGKPCVKLAIHPVALPQAVRRFTRDKVHELARKISSGKKLHTEVKDAAMGYVFATFMEPDTMRPHVADCSKTSESTFRIGTGPGPGTQAAKTSVFYLMQAKRWVLLWPDLPELHTKAYMKATYYDYIRVCQELEKSARAALGLHDIGTEEDAKFQAFLDGDAIRAHARALFDAKVAQLRPQTAVALDGSGKAPPTATTDATLKPLSPSGANTDGSVPAPAPSPTASGALDLVRDVLVLYALVVDVFAFFNAQTQAMFKKKPPELAKPLLAEVKRALHVQYNVPVSRPTSAAASGPSSASVTALPPIGRRWMKATDFAQFVYGLVTEKFHAVDDGAPPPTAAAASPGPAADSSRPGTAMSIPATPL